MVRTDSEVVVTPPGLANLLFGDYRHRVLSLLFPRPADRFHVRMISDRKSVV